MGVANHTTLAPTFRIADKIHQLHLDRPIPQRFWTWFTSVLHGNFGDTVYGSAITPDVWERAGVSFRLFLAGTIFAVVLGVLVGVSGAIRQYRFSDYASTFLSYILIAMPVFVLGTLLKYGATELNYATGSSFLRFTGETTPGFTGSFGAELWDRFRHLILPTIAIGLIEESCKLVVPVAIFMLGPLPARGRRAAIRCRVRARLRRV